MAKITIDDVLYEVSEGRTILQALDDLGLLMNGIDIPHYCWHPKLPIDGSCRLCQVEVEGMPKLQIACDTLVQEGMVVSTETERVSRAREGVMELLLVNHPLDCPICDQAGECKLQDYAFDYGVNHSRTKEPRRALRKRVDLGPTIVFDQERCILCRRCTRFCSEITSTGELGVFNRGDESVIETFPGTQLDNSYSMNVADLCPVGALTTKDFRFKVRVWFLEETPGVCTGCSKGCNIHIGSANNQVYRYVPRRNDEVNDTWICDEGRLSYKEISAPNRLTEVCARDASRRLQPVGFAEAVKETVGRLRHVLDKRGPEGIAVIASPHAANEDLYVLRKFCDGLGISVSGCPVKVGASDDFLIQKEKAANRMGARILGFGDPSLVIDHVKSGKCDALVLMGHELLHEDFLGGVEPLNKLETVVLMDMHHSPFESVAQVVFPIRHPAEKLGSFVNSAGHVQRFVPAVEPSFEAWCEGEILSTIAAGLELPGFDTHYDARTISKAMAEEFETTMKGRDCGSLDSQGLPVLGDIPK